MSLFNNPFKDLLGSIIQGESLTPELPKELRHHSRKTEEDIAQKIHPSLGDAVRKKNNLHDSLKNLADSMNIGKVVENQLFSEIKEDELNRGDHLYTQAPGFTHHGIYIGNHEVIHYSHDSQKKLYFNLN